MAIEFFNCPLAKCNTLSHTILKYPGRNPDAKPWHVSYMMEIFKGPGEL